ncbi:hypothetical protein T484DRAFT_1810836 [Baffinella frigidus]|nr:hypothetical protein T484DRAFT_1810836 [Cryptophyta sp. CCMP2293]
MRVWVAMGAVLAGVWSPCEAFAPPGMLSARRGAGAGSRHLSVPGARGFQLRRHVGYARMQAGEDQETAAQVPAVSQDALVDKLTAKYISFLDGTGSILLSWS